MPKATNKKDLEKVEKEEKILEETQEEVQEESIQEVEAEQGKKEEPIKIAKIEKVIEPNRSKLISVKFLKKHQIYDNRDKRMVIYEKHEKAEFEKHIAMSLVNRNVAVVI